MSGHLTTLTLRSAAQTGRLHCKMFRRESIRLKPGTNASGRAHRKSRSVRKKQKRSSLRLRQGKERDEGENGRKQLAPLKSLLRWFALSLLPFSVTANSLPRPGRR